MTTVNDAYNLYQYIVRKERGIYVTPAQFNANMDAGQLDAVSAWFSAYGADQKIHDAIRQLRVYQQFTSNASGFVTFPSNYIHLIGQPFTVAGSTVNRLDFHNEDEVAFALTSQLRPVTNDHPIAVDTSTGFSIYPQQTQIGFYWYLRRPAAIVFAYTQSGRTITYDSANSVQPEFSNIYWNNILARALVYAGVNMGEKGIEDYAKQYNAETQ